MFSQTFPAPKLLLSLFITFSSVVITIGVYIIHVQKTYIIIFLLLSIRRLVLGKDIYLIIDQ